MGIVEVRALRPVRTSPSGDVARHHGRWPYLVVPGRHEHERRVDLLDGDGSDRNRCTTERPGRVAGRKGTEGAVGRHQPDDTFDETREVRREKQGCLTPAR